LTIVPANIDAGEDMRILTQRRARGTARPLQAGDRRAGLPTATRCARSWCRAGRSARPTPLRLSAQLSCGKGTVTVDAAAEPLGGFLPGVHLRAEAYAVLEPGVGANSAHG
jgi:hypothetical protein